MKVSAAYADFPTNKPRVYAAAGPPPPEPPKDEPGTVVEECVCGAILKYLPELPLTLCALCGRKLKHGRPAKARN